MVMSAIETNFSRTTQWVSIGFEFRLTVHFTSLTMKTLICSFLSLFFLVSEIINKETPTKYEALTKGIFFHKELQIVLAEKF